MKKQLIFLIIILNNVISCQSLNIASKNNIIDGYINDIAKLSNSDSLILNKLKPQQFTTQIVFKSIDGNLIKVIINDKKFNYSYFNNNIYNNFKNVKVKIYTRELNLKDKKFLIMDSIEVIK